VCLNSTTPGNESKLDKPLLDAPSLGTGLQSSNTNHHACLQEFKRALSR
jgi:hypothetical protein